jgi:hypothetical protein
LQTTLGYPQHQCKLFHSRILLLCLLLCPARGPSAITYGNSYLRALDENALITRKRRRARKKVIEELVINIEEED